VTGQEAYRTVLLHMFEHAKAVSFKVRDIAWGQSGQVAYLRWNFVADVPALGKEPWVVEGMIEVALDKEGRVTAHIDHWDAAEQLHGRLPVIRNIIGFVRGRMRATKSE
ncbi:MAG: nuclear transport factor 2 family protein, partial [Rhodospirillaceae bacterium]